MVANRWMGAEHPAMACRSLHNWEFHYGMTSTVLADLHTVNRPPTRRVVVAT